MDQTQFWALCYASVLAMRLHPKNDGENPRDDIYQAAHWAKLAADQAINDWRNKCPAGSQE